MITGLLIPDQISKIFIPIPHVTLMKTIPFTVAHT